MKLSPFVRQLLVAGSPQLAALSVGGAVGYPGVLLQQLSSNDSSIHLDLDTSSWIGSIHGIAGIPSILMPTIMQWKGRKFAFIAACLISIIGWVLALTASSAVTILISESFHGLGTNCLLAVSLLSISEMVTPQFRNISMISFHVVQGLGMAVIGIIGSYLNWKTVGIVMGAPVTIAMFIAITWPESPYWLACKGEFDKCEKAFNWLRGTDEVSKKELRELISAQKENLNSVELTERTILKGFFKSLTRRDFFMPSFHMFVLLNLTYWSGSLVILIYAAQMIEIATHNANVSFFGGIIMNSVLFVGMIVGAVSVRRFNNKSILLLSTSCTTITLLGTSVTNFLQTMDVISSESLICLYLLIAYMIAVSLGVLPIIFTVAAELMPVKHRGIGGSLYVIYICVLHASSLKLAPYLFLYINLWGTLLLYAINTIVCGLFIWKFVPETKGKTLQEIENYYKYGNFEKHNVLCIDNDINITETELSLF